MEVNYNILATFCMFEILNKNFNNKKALYTNTTYFKQPQIHKPFSEIQKLWKRTVFPHSFCFKAPPELSRGSSQPVYSVTIDHDPSLSPHCTRPRLAHQARSDREEAKEGQAALQEPRHERANACTTGQNQRHVSEQVEKADDCEQMLGGLRTRGCFETKSINLMGGTVEIGEHTRSGLGRGLLSTGLPW